MAFRLEGANQLNEIIFQDTIDSFPLRDNDRKTTDAIASHALSIEALESGGSPPASSSAEVIAARDDEADLQSALRKGDEILGDAVFESILGEYLVKESTVPDDKFDVDSGSAIINGVKVRTESVQQIDPPNFSGVFERIDLVELGSSGTVTTATGAEFALGGGLAEAERPTNNTISLARAFLRSEASSPFAPRPIKDADDGTNSFIIPNNQRFFVQLDQFKHHTQYSNWIRNGAFLSINVDQTVFQWTPTNEASFARDTTFAFFGDFIGKFVGDGTAGGSFIEQQLPGTEALRDREVTVSVYMRLGAGTTAKTGRITIRQVGDTPESDFSQTVVLNSETFQRVHVVGRIDNSVTAIFLRLELDTTDPSSVTGFFDGVQFSIGRNLTEFEYPERIRIKDDGNTEFPGGIITDDLQFEANIAWQFPPPFDIFTNVRLITRT